LQAKYDIYMRKNPTAIAYTEHHILISQEVPVHVHRYRHEQSVEVHYHDFLEVAIVLKGNGSHTSIQGDSHLDVGDVIVIRPGAWHSYRDCSGMELYNCCFSVELLRNELLWARYEGALGHLLWTGPLAFNRRGILIEHLDKAAMNLCVQHLEALRELCEQSPSSSRATKIAYLLLFLNELAGNLHGWQNNFEKSFTPIHPAVREAVTLLEERPSHNWSLKELAENLHLDQFYLSRLFKNHVGLPPITYLACLRAELAATLLVRTGLPVARIGDEVGWTDPNYFARRFKSYFGISPSNYREEAAG
jgi:AraC family L-rhamnose operon transcriptional activator RhaR